MEMTTGTIAKTTTLNDEQLTSIQTFSDAAAMLQAAGIILESIGEYGTGFKLTDSKKLVGVPFLILQWRFNAGAYGPEGFVSVEAVTKHNEKVIFNDGSTGIRDQLIKVTAEREAKGSSHPQAGLVVENGLTASEFFYNAVTKEISRLPQTGPDWSPATTYYLAA